MPKQTDITIDQMIPDYSLSLKKLKDLYFDPNDNGLYIRTKTGTIRIGGTTTSTTTTT